MLSVVRSVREEENVKCTVFVQKESEEDRESVCVRRSQSAALFNLLGSQIAAVGDWLCGPHRSPARPDRNYSAFRALSMLIALSVTVRSLTSI